MANSNINNLASEYRPARNQSDNALVASRSITVSTAQDLIVAALNAATQSIVFSVETATCYVTWDGTTPSATNGHPIIANAGAEWNRDLAEAAKIFCATSARVHVSEMQTK